MNNEKSWDNPWLSQFFFVPLQYNKLITIWIGTRLELKWLRPLAKQ